MAETRFLLLRASCLAALLAGCSGTTDARSDAGPTGTDTGVVPGTNLDAGHDAGLTAREVVHVEGSGELLGAFVTEHGIVVVLRDRITVLDRSGRELMSHTAPRALVSAALRGDVLVVADETSVTALDLDLRERWSVDVAETCVSLALVGENRLVCGSGDAEALVWHTLDASTGAELSRSEPYWLRGTRAFAVPGRDAFISLLVSTPEIDYGPPQPSLFMLDETGAVHAGEEGSSSFPGKSQAFAFIGLPSDNIITSDSSFLRFDGCSPDGPRRCFAPEGMLGSIDGYEQYIGLDSDPASSVFGLVVELSEPHDGGGYCRTAVPCRVQVIDFTTRTLLREVPWNIEVEQVVSLRWDRWDDAVVVGWNDCDTAGRCTTWHVDAAPVD